MVGGYHLDRAIHQRLPQAFVICRAAHGRRADPFCPVRALQVFHRKEEILRAGLSHHRQAVLAGVGQLVGFPAGVHMHDIQRRTRRCRQAGGAQRGLDRAPGRAGVGMPFGRGVTRRQGLGHQHIDHVPVFGVHQGQHPVVAGDAQHLENLAVQQPQPPVIRGEHLDAGDAQFQQVWDFRLHRFIQACDIHVETKIDCRFAICLGVPAFDRLPQRGGLLRHEVDHRGCAAKSSRFVPGIMIVRRYRAEHRQVEMGVRVNAPWQHQLAFCIDDLGIWRMQISA